MVYVPKQKFEALKTELNAEKLFIAYEDSDAVIVVGFNGSDEPKMMKIPRAELYGNVAELIRRVFPWRR